MRNVVALHGFAGTGRMWDAVSGDLVAPDLPGHGSAAHVRPVAFEACVESILAAAPPRFTLAGYSLGGRLALHVALAAPARVERLVLVATTAGIEDDGERLRRRATDEALAAAIEHGTIEDFLARWTAMPLFAGDPPAAVARWHEDIRRNQPSGLAAALRGLGSGVMPSLWDRLGELTMPAAVLAGERDARYVAIAERLAAALPGAIGALIVPGAGHGLPREVPEIVERVLNAPAPARAPRS